MDVLQEHLARARASGGVFARSVARPPWGLRLPGTIQLAVHAVVRGSAWIWLDDPDAAIQLVPGDVALVRGGPDHHVAHDAGAACLGHEEFVGLQAAEPQPDDGQATVFLCGAYRFSGDVGRGLLDALSPIMHLPTVPDDRLTTAVGLLARELAVSEPGQQTVLDRLLDVVLVYAMRRALDRGGDSPRWFRAAGDPRLGPALRAIHSDPGHHWTVTELASLSGLSRAAFARAFQQALDQAPMQYLTDWRMTLARDQLRAGDLTLTEIADRTGYASQYAFATAFRRHHGVPPGRWRQAHSLA
ncbi:MAG TPA: AraC family transcriptional regulator [Solirubrobacterales bacterium]|nr:AraC family transcriptional regulator [Solirubrobacterales bacterium]